MILLSFRSVGNAKYRLLLEGQDVQLNAVTVATLCTSPLYNALAVDTECR